MNTMKSARPLLMLLMVVLLVPLAVGCASTGAGEAPESGGEQASVEAAIRSQIATHYPGETFDIGVSVEPDGTVTLTGTVDDVDKRTRIGEIAQDTEGVRSVINQIQVSE